MGRFTNGRGIGVHVWCSQDRRYAAGQHAARKRVYSFEEPTGEALHEELLWR